MIWKHPKAVGKNWLTHLMGAWKMAVIFQIGVFRCIIHGLIPDFDIKAATNTAAKVVDHIPDEV
ncbi:MAG TPA: hypothetical protein EYQ73_05425 [Candidatus Poseidoniales archaeon]|jgi:hypothetical protein|nr:MAG: hypothetical protein CXT71_03910 [Euryarchaeota archaeon]HIF46220.1 hypothetical protein [Candidatus Poseidoniales archaeon]HIL65118.1 hypothetical protein [Candidatus Poseidoniales archaeon]